MRKNALGMMTLIWSFVQMTVSFRSTETQAILYVLYKKNQNIGTEAILYVGNKKSKNPSLFYKFFQIPNVSSTDRSPCQELHRLHAECNGRVKGCNEPFGNGFWTVAQLNRNAQCNWVLLRVNTPPC